MNGWLTHIPQKYWAYLALLLWGTLCLLLLQHTPYGIDENAARVLLLTWSVADNVVSPIVTLGLPDLRAVILAPVGFLWTGNVFVAKVATMFVVSGLGWAFYAWQKRKGDSEGALLATGLLLISPIILEQIDTISVAPYLLITFILGAWSDRIYRESPQIFGGMYFAQLFLCLVSITLHPAGLAYPLVLLWAWYKSPLDQQRSYFIGGIVFAVLLALILTMGWGQVEWFNNPIRSLSRVISGSPRSEALGILDLISGVGILIILLLVISKQAVNLWSDFLGRILVFALVIGLLASDETWSTLALVVCLYWGLPLLLPTYINSSNDFWGQRGAAMLLLFILSTTFMLVDKARYQRLMAGYLSPRDHLIKTLAEDSENFLNDDPTQPKQATKPVRIASQWPGLTMLACRCDALPLPPPTKDSDALLAMLRGINYLIFDPRDPLNSSLARNLATMDAGKVETIALQQGGVIVEIKNPPSVQNP